MAPQTPGSRRKRCARALPLSRTLQLPDFSDDEIALHAAEVVEEQLAVEMIDLVLKGPGEKSRTFHNPLRARPVLGANNRLGRSRHRGIEPRNAEATLFFELHALTLHELRIDERQKFTATFAD